MKLLDRTLVEGTVPPLYIGHKEFRDKSTGRMVPCRRWHAEWNHGGRKFDESLKTTNKQEAIRAAHKIIDRLERGEVKQVQRRIEWQEFIDAYMDFQTSKGRPPRTIQKYRRALTDFMTFCLARKRLRPMRLPPPTSGRSTSTWPPTGCTSPELLDAICAKIGQIEASNAINEKFNRCPLLPVPTKKPRHGRGFFVY